MPFAAVFIASLLLWMSSSAATTEVAATDIAPASVELEPGPRSPPGELVPPETSDFGEPLLGFGGALVLIFIVLILLVLVGIGIALGLIACIAAAVLLFLGIVSFSTAVALLQRSPGAGVRVLFLQAGALLGAVAGIGAAYLIAWIAHADWSTLQRIGIGAASGMAYGLLIALIFNFTWTRVAKMLLHHYKNWKRRRQGLPLQPA